MLSASLPNLPAHLSRSDNNLDVALLFQSRTAPSGLSIDSSLLVLGRSYVRAGTRSVPERVHGYQIGATPARSKVTQNLRSGVCRRSNDTSCAERKGSTMSLVLSVAYAADNNLGQQCLSRTLSPPVTVAACSATSENAAMIIVVDIWF